MSDVYSTAREWGRALFMLTEEVGSTERVREEAHLMSEVISGNPEYEKMLDTPALSRDERTALIDEAFSRFDVNLLNLAKLRAERRMAHLLVRTLGSYEEEYMESRGIIRAEVISAVALSEERCERLGQKLAKITGKQVTVCNKVDPTILGGLKLRYMGIQRDGSVKTRLETFSRALGDAVI